MVERRLSTQSRLLRNTESDPEEYVHSVVSLSVSPVRWQMEHTGSLEPDHSITTNIISKTTTLVILPDPALQ